MESKMKIAIPFFRNRVSNRLDSSENILIVTLDKGTIKNQKKIRLVHNEPRMMTNILNQLEVDVLICGGITEYYAKRFAHSQIQVIPWVTGELDDVIKSYLTGRLKNRFESYEII
jgi:predicted Fe-Mo cluster-binding NifX family protein